MNAIKMGWTGAKWLFGRTGLGVTNLWGIGSLFKSHDDVDCANIQHEFVPLLGDCGQGKLVVKEGFHYSTCLMRPKSRGFVELKSADPREPSRIVNNHFENGEDQKAMIAAVRKMDGIVRQPDWDQIRGEAVTPPLRKMSDADIAKWLRANILTQCHPCASCGMGVDDMSVVDDEGRVHGVQNLRVIDASIIPLITSGNLQSPTLMVAEKIADRMKGKSLPPQAARYADMKT